MNQTHVKIEHFVIKKDERPNNHGAIIFETLLQVLRDNGFRIGTVEIQSVNQGGQNDPVMKFL